MIRRILEKNAAEFRHFNGLGSKDAIRLKSLLSQLNVITIFRPLGSSFGGMAIKIEDNGDVTRLMLVNSEHNIGKQHFTICHELYHLYIQKNFTATTCNTGLFEKKQVEEWNADVFASILLLPEEGIMALIPENELRENKINLSTILKLEQYYSCSRAALLYRLKDLELINKDYSEKFKANVKSSAVQFGYETSLYESGNKDLVLGDYGSLARNLLEKENISQTHYTTLMKDLGMNSEFLELLFDGQSE
jgi:Zn-dependent peptidase ImmA (M78 family)